MGLDYVRILIRRVARPATLLGLALTACQAHPRRLIIDRVVIDAPASLDNRVAERDAIRLAVGERLRKDSSVEFRPGQPGATHVLQLELGELQTAGTRKPGRPVAVRLSPIGDQPEFFAVGAGTAGKDLPTAVMAGFDDAWEVIISERVLEEKDGDALVDSLTERDSRLRDFAIQRLGERRLTAGVAPLIARLEKEEDPRLLLRIVGALVAIGDARAVEPLIALTHKKDSDFVVQIVYALGALGSRQAEAYLVTMASGHPNDEVRRAAKQALNEMLRHKARKAKNSKSKGDRG